MTSISLYKVAIKKGTCCGKIEIFLLQTFAKNYSHSLFYRTKLKSHYNFPSSNDYVCQTAFAKLFVLFCHFLVVMIVAVLWYGGKDFFLPS